MTSIFQNILNLIYAIFGVILTRLFMALGGRIFDKMTAYDKSRQLEGECSACDGVSSIYIDWELPSASLSEWDSIK